MKWVSAIGMCLISVYAFSQYTVSGKIAHHGGRILLLAPTVSGQCDTLGNMVSADGTFCFKGKVDMPVATKIHAVGTRLHFPLYLEDGNYEVEADAKRPAAYKVTGGGEMQRLRNELREAELALNHRRDSLCSIYEKEYGKEDYFGRLQVQGVMERYADLYDKVEEEFIRRHDNLLSADLLVWRIDKLIRRKTLPAKYALLGEQARNSVQGRWLKPYAEKISRIVVGGIAPNLTMQTPEGGTLSIYDVKAKVKILDFWASWCGPCRAENPNVKRIYELYKSKGLEIISISLDAKADAWRKAIQADGLPWKHISDLKGWNSIVTDVYEIHAIPHLFVLDQDNRIIAEGLRGEALEECVRKALEKE